MLFEHVNRAGLYLDVNSGWLLFGFQNFPNFRSLKSPILKPEWHGVSSCMIKFVERWPILFFNLQNVVNPCSKVAGIHLA